VSPEADNAGAPKNGWMTLHQFMVEAQQDSLFNNLLAVSPVSGEGDS